MPPSSLTETCHLSATCSQQAANAANARHRQHGSIAQQCCKHAHWKSISSWTSIIMTRLKAQRRQRTGKPSAAGTAATVAIIVAAAAAAAPRYIRQRVRHLLLAAQRCSRSAAAPSVLAMYVAAGARAMARARARANLQGHVRDASCARAGAARGPPPYIASP